MECKAFGDNHGYTDNTPGFPRDPGGSDDRNTNQHIVAHQCDYRPEPSASVAWDSVSDAAIAIRAFMGFPPGGNFSTGHK
jgi:hypothetical protein